MKSLLSVIVLLLGLARVGVAQDPVPDTLDWRGYYPLQVGNAWEWKTWIFVDYRANDRLEILSDTVVSGTHYFVTERILSETEMGVHGVRVFKTLVRYDSATASVVGRSLSGSEGWTYTCTLGADFGSTIECPDGGELWSAGEYAVDQECLQIGSDCAPYAATKAFWTLGGGATFFHGIGFVPMVGDGSQGSIELTYVRVSGKEYGERVVYLGREEMPRQLTLRLGIYPNPARDRVWLALPESGMAHYLTVYDVLGRRVQESQVCEPGACELTVDRFPPGLYIARVSTADGTERSGPFMIRR